MAEEDSKEQPVVEKKSRKRLLGVLVTSVLITGAGVAGTILGPRLLGMEDGEGEPETNASAEPEAEENAKLPVSRAFQPVIVDVRDKQLQPHHMKVGISVELKDAVGKEEFETLMSRGREAAIAHLRGRVYDELVDPAQFDATAKELGDRIIKAMGEKHVSRVVITDFVAQ